MAHCLVWSLRTRRGTSGSASRRLLPHGWPQYETCHICRKDAATTHVIGAAVRFPDGLAPTDFHDGDAVAAFRVPSHFQLPRLAALDSSRSKLSLLIVSIIPLKPR